MPDTLMFTKPNISQTNHSIILDLDHTLLATQDTLDSLRELNIYNDPQYMSLVPRTYILNLPDVQTPGEGHNLQFWGILRPHVKEFLVFCFSYFRTVGVWSAGKRNYVEAIVEFLFRDISPPHFVLTFDDIEMDTGGNVIKDLNTVYNLSPITRKFVNEANTLVVDDTPSTFSQNVDNAILIPEYRPSLNISALSRDDPTLQQLMTWLNRPEVREAVDVRNIDKSKIFAGVLRSSRRKL